MIDAEASRHRADTHSPGGDSLHEVLFKEPPVKPPPVAVNMYGAPLLAPLISRAFLFFVQERSGRVRPRSARELAAAPQAEVFIRNPLII
jgi:hypothetical protein